MMKEVWKEIGTVPSAAVRYCSKCKETGYIQAERPDGYYCCFWCSCREGQPNPNGVAMWGVKWEEQGFKRRDA